MAYNWPIFHLVQPSSWIAVDNNDCEWSGFMTSKNVLVSLQNDVRTQKENLYSVINNIPYSLIVQTITMTIKDEKKHGGEGRRGVVVNLSSLTWRKSLSVFSSTRLYILDK